jgi:LysM repeat protein
VTTPPQTSGGPGGKLAAAAGGRRNLLLALGGGVALVAFLMSRASGGGGGAAGGSTQQMDGYDSTPYDQYNALQSQLEDIQSQIDGGKVTPGTATTPAPTPASPKPKPVTLPWRPPTAKSPQPPKKTTLPATTHKTVTIKSGDTLSGIAKKAGISMGRLKSLNPTFWKNPKYDSGNKIWAGGKVKVS